jgi:hypothetical protein
VGVRAFTFYLTNAEADFVRSVFARKFGYLPTIGAMRCGHGKAVVPIQKAGGEKEGFMPRAGEQMELL